MAAGPDGGSRRRTARGQGRGSRGAAVSENVALRRGPPPGRSVETEGTFTICGRPRDDKGAEKISGTIIYLPAGSYKDVRTLRIRGKIEDFNRERYHIGPKWTDSWLARVQELAPVVATDGTIEVNLFATEPGTR
jgi:hypothetical protein